MALLPSEVERVRFELGVHLLGVGAEPNTSDGHLEWFTQVMSPYLSAGASTTSTTTVTEATTPTPSTLALASATGFATGDTVVVDVDSRQEMATIQSLSSSNATLLLTKAHSGTYPVTVEGGESIVRGILGQLRAVSLAQSEAASAAGIKRVDEIEFFPSGTASESRRGQLEAERMRLRDELSAAVGFPNGWRRRASAGSGIALY